MSARWSFVATLAFLSSGAQVARAQETPEPPPETAIPDEPPTPPAEPRLGRPRPPPQPAGAIEPGEKRAGSADDPVVRAQEGDWGMFFRFGGLSTMVASGDSRDLNGFLITQVGLRAVLSETSIVPFFLGTGLRSRNPEGLGDAQVDVGLDVGVGYEYHFRVWRRISPFFGFGLGFGFGDPAGADNAAYGIGIGPSIGVEYYVADRVSLIAQYLLTFELQIVPDQLTQIAFSTLSGGALTLVFYF